MVLVMNHPLVDLPRGWEVVSARVLDPYDGADAVLVRNVHSDLFMLMGEDGRLRPISQPWARAQANRPEVPH